MGPEEIIDEFVAPPLVAAGFRRSGKRRFVASGEHSVFIDVHVPTFTANRVGLRLQWVVVPRVWDEFHRSRGEKRMRDSWALTQWHVQRPDDEQGYFTFYNGDPTGTGPELRRQLAEEVVSFLAPRVTAEGLRDWSYLQGSLATKAKIVASIDHVSVEQARELLQQYPVVRTSPIDVDRYEFLCARVEARAAAESLTPEKVVGAAGPVPVESAVRDPADPVAAVVTGGGRADLGAYGSVLVCRVVPGLAVLSEDADDLDSVTRLGGTWVMARYHRSTLAGDAYELLEAVAGRTGGPVLVGMVFDDFAVDVTGFSARAGFWRMLLPAGLDEALSREALAGQPDRARVADPDAMVAAVSAWADEAGLTSDGEALRAVVTTEAADDDRDAAGTALDALLAAVALADGD